MNINGSTVWHPLPHPPKASLLLYCNYSNNWRNRSPNIQVWHSQEWKSINQCFVFLIINLIYQLSTHNNEIHLTQWTVWYWYCAIHTYSSWGEEINVFLICQIPFTRHQSVVVFKFVSHHIINCIWLPTPHPHTIF